MKPIFAVLGAVWLAGALGAQSMMEHAAAAAGAVAGTAGGKIVSIGIDKVLGRAAEAGTEPNATKAAARKPSPSPAASNAETQPTAANGGVTHTMGSASPSSSPASPAPRRVARERSKVVFADAPQRAGESQRIVESQTYIMLQPPSQQDFAKVAEGESRSEVVSALGVPWSHVTIPDDGHLVEIMSWYDGNRRVGTVRLDNGKVVSTVLN